MAADFSRVWLVEDLVSMLESFGAFLRGTPIDFRPVSHELAMKTGAQRWCADDLVLVDAYDLGRRRKDPTSSVLAALDVVALVQAMPEAQRPTVAVYSTHMRQPEVHIPLRCAGGIAAFFDLDALHAEGIVRMAGGDLSGGLEEPTAEDWAVLNPHLPVGADVAHAHALMRSRPDAWRLIYDDRTPFSKATQVWVTRTVLPVLGVESNKGYRVAVDVVRQVAQLPVS